MFAFLKRIFKPKYNTLNEIEINRIKIISNFNYLKRLQPNAEIFPVLKSNAYGHGLREMCHILNKTSAKMVIVDSFPEAQIAYHHFKGKILILEEIPIEAYKYIRLSKTEFVVYNSATLKYISRYGKRARIHLFVNSGMNREGIQNLKSFIKENRCYLLKVEVVGLCSHLASADNQSSFLNKAQEDSFMTDLEILTTAGFSPRWVHLGNSAAIFYLNNRLLTAYRPGFALYGYPPINIKNSESELQPALQVYSHVVSIQSLKKGESVSYNETYRAPGDVSIDVIPFGYFEGLDRRLSNQAQFLIENNNSSYYAPVAGKVCMNLTCLEIKGQSVKVGDVVKIVSDDLSAPNSVLNIAKLMNTIPYEFLVKLQPSVRKKII